MRIINLTSNTVGKKNIRKLMNEKKGVYYMEEINFLNGNNRANRIFPDGYILNASENELKEYKYRFNNVDYYFETTRIILNLGKISSV